MKLILILQLGKAEKFDAGSIGKMAAPFWKLCLGPGQGPKCKCQKISSFLPLCCLKFLFRSGQLDSSNGSLAFECGFYILFHTNIC